MGNEIPGEGVLLRKRIMFDWIEILLLPSVWDKAKMQKDFFFYPTPELAEDTMFSIDIG